MKKYEIKDLRDNTVLTGTFEQVKEWFKQDLSLINEEDRDLFVTQNSEIDEAIDINDLWNILTKHQCGMAFPFEWKEVD